MAPPIEPAIIINCVLLPLFSWLKAPLGSGVSINGEKEFASTSEFAFGGVWVAIGLVGPGFSSDEKDEVEDGDGDNDEEDVDIDDKLVVGDVEEVMIGDWRVIVVDMLVISFCLVSGRNDMHLVKYVWKLFGILLPDDCITTEGIFDELKTDIDVCIMTNEVILE